MMSFVMVSVYLPGWSPYLTFLFNYSTTPSGMGG